MLAKEKDESSKNYYHRQPTRPVRKRRRKVIRRLNRTRSKDNNGQRDKANRFPNFTPKQNLTTTSDKQTENESDSKSSLSQNPTLSRPELPYSTPPKRPSLPPFTTPTLGSFPFSSSKSKPVSKSFPPTPSPHFKPFSKSQINPFLKDSASNEREELPPNPLYSLPSEEPEVTSEFSTPRSALNSEDSLPSNYVSEGQGKLGSHFSTPRPILDKTRFEPTPPPFSSLSQRPHKPSSTSRPISSFGNQPYSEYTSGQELASPFPDESPDFGPEQNLPRPSSYFVSSQQPTTDSPSFQGNVEGRPYQPTPPPPTFGRGSPNPFSTSLPDRPAPSSYFASSQDSEKLGRPSQPTEHSTPFSAPRPDFSSPNEFSIPRPILDNRPDVPPPSSYFSSSQGSKSFFDNEGQGPLRASQQPTVHSAFSPFHDSYLPPPNPASTPSPIQDIRPDAPPASSYSSSSQGSNSPSFDSYLPPPNLVSTPSPIQDTRPDAPPASSYSSSSQGSNSPSFDSYLPPPNPISTPSPIQDARPDAPPASSYSSSLQGSNSPFPDSYLPPPNPISTTSTIQDTRPDVPPPSSYFSSSQGSNSPFPDSYLPPFNPISTPRPVQNTRPNASPSSSYSLSSQGLNPPFERQTPLRNPHQPPSPPTFIQVPSNPNPLPTQRPSASQGPDAPPSSGYFTSSQIPKPPSQSPNFDQNVPSAYGAPDPNNFPAPDPLSSPHENSFSESSPSFEEDVPEGSKADFKEPNVIYGSFVPVDSPAVSSPFEEEPFKEEPSSPPRRMLMNIVLRPGDRHARSLPKPQVDVYSESSNIIVVKLVFPLDQSIRGLRAFSSDQPHALDHGQARVHVIRANDNARRERNVSNNHNLSPINALNNTSTTPSSTSTTISTTTPHPSLDNLQAQSKDSERIESMQGNFVLNGYNNILNPGQQMRNHHGDNEHYKSSGNKARLLKSSWTSSRHRPISGHFVPTSKIQQVQHQQPQHQQPHVAGPPREKRPRSILHGFVAAPVSSPLVVDENRVRTPRQLPKLRAPPRRPKSFINGFMAPVKALRDIFRP